MLFASSQEMYCKAKSSIQMFATYFLQSPPNTSPSSAVNKVIQMPKQAVWYSLAFTPNRIHSITLTASAEIHVINLPSIPCKAFPPLHYTSQYMRR